MPDLVIVGAGGHGREIYDTLAAVDQARPRTWTVEGFVDDGEVDHERLARLGATFLGTSDVLEDRGGWYVVGVGVGEVRARLSERFDNWGCRAATIVHPGARIGLDVELGDGAVVFDRCNITTNVRIGRHTHLNVGCSVAHDSRVGDFVQFSPGVLVNGDCHVGDGVFFGTGAIVTRGCSVGDGARVGAGAVVLDDVPPGATVVGAPARPVRGG